jgi:magnesium transporter
VVDESWKLVDALDLRRFILADPADKVEGIMDYSFVAVAASKDQEEAVRLMQRYALIALPVVDSTGVLLGIVTIDDVLDVAQEEATEDFQRTASVAPLRVSYNAAGVWTLYSKRIGWLAALVLVNLLSSGVIAMFEETLAAVVALAFFIPLIIDTGGNAGTQSAIIIVRALSTGDVKLNQWLRTFLRELAIGVLIGITIGLLGLGLGILRDGYMLGIVVFLTMLVMLVITNMIGMALPFLLTRLNLDPAAASGPLITSIADVVGLTVYFTFASKLLVG